jgi:cytochrome c
MSSLELNKIAGAIILVLLVGQVISTIGDALVHPRAHGPAAVSVANAPTQGPKKEEKIEPVSGLLASASVDKGKAVAKKCEACHTFQKGGPNKIGPDLWGIVGRPVAAHEGFAYSSALKQKGGEWDYESINQFIAHPGKTVPGTKMTFVGLDKTQDRADVIAYLRTLADSPAPLPPPEAAKPAEEAKPAESAAPAPAPAEAPKP